MDLGLNGWRATDRSFEDLSGAIELFAPFFDFDEFLMLVINRAFRLSSSGNRHSARVLPLKVPGESI